MSEKRPTLPAHCSRCAQPVTLHLSDRTIGQTSQDRPVLQRGIWTCPHCERLNDGGFIGSVALASRRYEPGRSALS